MSGFMIPSKPLTPEAAQLLEEALKTATVPAIVADKFLQAVFSLRRISEGVDHVQTAKQTDGRGEDANPDPA